MDASKSFICKVDKRGGIYLPLALRKAFDLSQNSQIEFLAGEGDTIQMTKKNGACFFCGAFGPLTRVHGISLCQNCCAQAAALDDAEQT